MKNIIAIVSTVIVVILMGYTASQGGAYNGGEHGKVIKNIGTKSASTQPIQPKVAQKTKENKEQDKLSALKQKAGNIGGFDVSQRYKSNCSSCHGANGSGFQNGKPMMGPKLFGKSQEYIYNALVEFRSGRKENIVMKGLLLSMDDDDLKYFAKEIGDFPNRAKALKNK